MQKAKSKSSELGIREMGRRDWAMLAHIVALGVIFGVSIFAFLHFEGVLLMQLYVVVAAVIAYDVWGMFYHYFRRRLTLDLVLEYLLVGAVVILLFFWTLFS